MKPDVMQPPTDLEAQHEQPAQLCSAEEELKQREQRRLQGLQYYERMLQGATSSLQEPALTPRSPGKADREFRRVKPLMDFVGTSLIQFPAA